MGAKAQKRIGLVAAAYTPTDDPIDTALLARLDQHDAAGMLSRDGATSTMGEGRGLRASGSLQAGDSALFASRPDRALLWSVMRSPQHRTGAYRSQRQHLSGVDYFVASLGPIDLRHTRGPPAISEPVVAARPERALPKYVRYSLLSASASRREYAALQGSHDIALQHAEPTDEASLGSLTRATFQPKTTEIDLGVASFDQSGSFGFNTGRGKLSVKIREDKVRLLYVLKF